jgi:hypothetical protein
MFYRFILFCWIRGKISVAQIESLVSSHMISQNEAASIIDTTQQSE